MNDAFASDAIDYLAIGMLIAAIGIAGARSLGLAFLLLFAQSLMLAGAGFTAGLAEESDHILAGATLTLAVKAVLVPLLLWVALLRLRTSHDTQPSVSPRLNVLSGAALALVFSRALGGEPFHTAIGAEFVLPMAVAIMLIGILTMVTHQQALSQITGFLVIENGMALAALTATFGMPLVIEFGILLDLLLALFVAFAYVARMHVIFGSLHTKHLRSLRG
jgi:hydrogenase-4 component E